MVDNALKLKEAFRKVDANGDGKLQFEDFLTLIRKGHPGFSEDHAEALFKVVDSDLSGEIEFSEFVDYLYDNKSYEDFLVPELDDRTEAEAKAHVMGTSTRIRAMASQSIKKKGGQWSAMSWKERMDVVLALEAVHPELAHQASSGQTWEQMKKEREEDVEKAKALSRETSSALRAGSKEKASEGKGEKEKDKQQEVGRSQGNQKQEEAAAGKAPQGGEDQAEEKKPTPKKELRKAKGRSGHMMAEMSQSEMVDYSLCSEDLRWAGSQRGVVKEMADFKEHLRDASGPFDDIVLERYLAKGTAGWVFQVSRKSTGERVALKLIRLTQVRTGIKEWYVSKMMREEEFTGIVLTDETTYVLDRDTAPDLVQEELKDAGPVPFYVCFLQEFVGGGSLEGLAQDGRLTPAMMLQALEEVGSTLARLHAHNVQHRDIKPENVLVNMEGDRLVATKLCDFGRAEVDESRAGRADDVRRFGVMFFSLATGEGWTANRLIHEEHSALCGRLKEAVTGDRSLRGFPAALEQILDGGLEMPEVVTVLQELRAAL